jgi:hypothetical protein
MSDDRDGVLPGRLLVLNVDRGSTEDCEADGTVDSGRLGFTGRGPEGASREVLASEVSGVATMATHSLAREASCVHVPSRDHVPSCEHVGFDPILPLSVGFGRLSRSHVGVRRSAS